jgi:hypothetical protein
MDITLDLLKIQGHLYGGNFSVFVVLEIAIINSFLFSKMRKHNFRILTALCSVLFYIACSILWFNHPDAFFANVPSLFGIEGIFIAIPSLLLIYEILKSDLTVDLNLNPNFIIASGLLFYFGLSVPIFFYSGNVFFSNDIREIYLFLLFLLLIFYIVLLLTFIKAYLCPRLQTMN